MLCLLPTMARRSSLFLRKFLLSRATTTRASSTCVLVGVASAIYKQVVKLPCAKYRLEYWTININPMALSW